MRISRDDWGLQLAEVTALRGTCLRRRVGCVLVDARGRVLATGYNGSSSGTPHCNEATATVYDDDRTTGTPFYGNACPGAGLPTGVGLDSCRAAHAEMSALLQCRDADAIYACYVTVSPCVTCTKLLANTDCRRVVFRERYAADGGELWASLGREWLRVPS